MTYAIKYSNGRVDSGHETYSAAVAAFALEHEDCEIGHDGDLANGGDRTLCWACADDAEDDDGARAAASIVVER